MSSLAAVQTALMAALRAGISVLDHRVFDFVPEGPVKPYLTISVPSDTPIDETCWERTEIVFQIDIWSEMTDSREVKDIAGDVRALLHERDMDVPGHAIDRMRVEGIFYSREQDTRLHRARVMLGVEARPL